MDREASWHHGQSRKGGQADSQQSEQGGQLTLPRGCSGTGLETHCFLSPEPLGCWVQVSQHAEQGRHSRLGAAQATTLLPAPTGNLLVYSGRSPASVEEAASGLGPEGRKQRHEDPVVGPLKLTSNNQDPGAPSSPSACWQVSKSSLCTQAGSTRCPETSTLHY